MAKKMLIDATHAEETRVVVVDGNKVEEFDFESEAKRQLAGNIYLAKVTRVEPSLQAAFVDYGGNRHGFLAFSEIHPDYYQIPVADREALMEEELAYAEALRARDDEEDEKPKRNRRGRGRSKAKAAEVKSDDAVETQEVESTEINGMETIDLDDTTEAVDAEEGLSPSETGVEETPVDAPEAGAAENTVSGSETETPQDTSSEPEVAVTPAEAQSTSEGAAKEAVADQGDAKPEADDEAATQDDASEDDSEDDGDDHEDTAKGADATEKDGSIESVADDDDQDDIRPPRKPRPRRYKIQEVIKVRQILLVQVVKEERGNKGAALTTYLSLAGRYCVLMPNTARGGGISRKITNAADRKKLKTIATEIDVPQGAGLIVRTAGAKRTKTEIKRDYEYLQRLWEQIRDLTLKSIAPAKIYEEGDLIKRSIRDLYNREIDEVLVEGERGYRNAKDFMKMIMPSHAKNVQQYTEALPLFARFQVESYLGGMFNPTVQLKSGGYIVIGVTEALVAVDVNSGKATKEGSIEETALKTNLEAAEEVARQLRLRDLAGLIVIDFIDMDERKNNAAVEKRLKDKLKTDRARIQVGRISGFGLLEMSRQRLRPGMIEATTAPCPHCHGTGLIRSDDSLALQVLRQIEEEGTRRRSREVLIKCPVGIANYLMNAKREHIAVIEARYGMAIRIEGDPSLVSPDFTMEKFKTATRHVPEATAPVVSVDTKLMSEVDEDAAESEEAIVDAPEADGEEQPKRKRRRRRRRRGKGNQGEDGQNAGEEDTSESAEEAPSDGKTGDEAKDASDDQDKSDDAQEGESVTEEDAPKPKKRRSRSRSRKKTEVAEDVTAEAATDTAAAQIDAAPTELAPEVDIASVSTPSDVAEISIDESAEAQPEPVAEPVMEASPEPEAEASAEDEHALESGPKPEAAPEPVPEPELEPTAVQTAPKPDAPPKKKRTGWWSRG
ncbi:MAG: Rne/Rng family ribonuclease [Marinovum sp.]|nr:Rne/Rng family ribonuclease [Marinovum sp.]